MTRRAVLASAAAALALPGVALAEPAVRAMPGPPGLRIGDFALAPLGYEAHEFLLSGVASAFELAGPVTSDGVWHARTVRPAPFGTRLVVVRPSDPRRFSGTVVAEWLNVSNGVDDAADWTAVHREILRRGHAYVAVSAQKQGVDGTPTPGAMPLKAADPARYAALSHPGDAWSYDIFAQAARAIRADGALLGIARARRVLAIGVSQSATFLVSFVNAVEPLAPVFDGYLIHSRFGTAAPLDGTPIVALDPAHPAPPVRIRTDRRAPVLTVETETDVIGGYLIGFHAARQPDGPRLRVWEIAGGAHVDTYSTSVGAIDSGAAPPALLAARYHPSASVGGLVLARSINSAPQTHHVLEAGLRALDGWVRTGRPPVTAPPLAIEQPVTGEPRLAVDSLGIARGGIRTPWVDVPLARLSGVGNSGSPAAFIFGVTEPFDAATRNRLYRSRDDYLRRFAAALDRAIAAGFLLADDRGEILAVARASAW